MSHIYITELFRSCFCQTKNKHCLDSIHAFKTLWLKRVNPHLGLVRMAKKSLSSGTNWRLNSHQMNGSRKESTLHRIVTSSPTTTVLFLGPFSINGAGRQIWGRMTIMQSSIRTFLSYMYVCNLAAQARAGSNNNITILHINAVLEGRFFLWICNVIVVISWPAWSSCAQT